MKRSTLPLLGGLLLLAACRDLPTGLQPGEASWSLAAGTCEVTEAGDAGAGTLRARIADASCATITFGVAGPIAITGAELSIDRPLTIAGPANGITVGRTAGEGAIFSIGPSGNVEISRLTITGGNGMLRVDMGSVVAGGGIYNYGGTLTLTNSTVSGNSALPNPGDGVGGGIVNANAGTLTLTNSTVSGNTAGYGGGGIYNDGGTLTLTNSTVSGNTGGYGGGINSRGPSITLLNSTIFGNSAVIGGGIYKESGRTPGTLTLRNTIVANNLEGFADNRSLGNCVTSPGIQVHDGGYNLSDTSCDFIAPTSLPNTDPQLGELSTANGGPTATHALPATSPAVNRIPVVNGSCNDSGVTTDQRGVSRPQGSACDIGAFELEQTPPAPTYTFLGFSAPVENPGPNNVLNVARAGQTIPLKWRLLDGSGNPVSTLGGVSLTVANYSCGLSETEHADMAYAAGKSGLQNLGDGYYQFNWATPKSYANSCQSLTLTLQGIDLDPAPQALFKFTR